MRHIFLLILFFTFNLNGQGLKFTPQEIMGDFDELKDDTYGFSESVPSRYSFEKYVPPVLQQRGGTCVGFSSLYYALSTMYNIKFNISDKRGKFAHAFDPYYIYSVIQNQVDDNCESGLFVYQAIELMTKIGAKKMFFPPYLTCSSKWTESKLRSTFNITSPYTIDTFYIVKLEIPNLISLMKKALYYNVPIVAGMSITDSMYPRSAENPTGVGSDGLWNPSELDGLLGGHAMTIVGYDDYKYGGSFRVVNSWGTNYGDGGYIWVRYRDFKKYTQEAYFFELNENLASNRFDKIQMNDGKYRRIVGDFGKYEGQWLNQGYNGKAIFTSPSNTIYISDFKNGEMNGYTIFFDDDGTFSANAVDNQFYDINKFGFAGADEYVQTENELKSYLDFIKAGVKIRKANSTKFEDDNPKVFN